MFDPHDPGIKDVDPRFAIVPDRWLSGYSAGRPMTVDELRQWTTVFRNKGAAPIERAVRRRGHWWFLDNGLVLRVDQYWNHEYKPWL